MLEKALKGSPNQLMQGLTITGMSRDVSWGFYIAQFTYLVGLAASGVMIVLPYYFHHYKKFKDLVIFGEFMAIAAVVMCLGFIHRRHRPAPAHAEHRVVPHAQLHPVLGHDRPERLSHPERSGGLDLP
jgi:Polysulphide reductase